MPSTKYALSFAQSNDTAENLQKVLDRLDDILQIFGANVRRDEVTRYYLVINYRYIYIDVMSKIDVEHVQRVAKQFNLIECG